MDVSRYSYECQAVLHFGLRYAKGLGHDYLEVEHVALAVLRRDWSRVDPETHAALERGLEEFLQKFPKRFGRVSVAFGPRLNQALDAAEAKFSSRPIEIQELWPLLVQHSDAMKRHLKQSEDDKAKDFQRWDIPNAAKAAPEPKAPEKQVPTRGIIKNEAVKKQAEKSQNTKKLQDDLDKPLRDFTVDLTEQASRGQLDPVIGRDTEIRRVMEILGRKKKNNPILLGDPGVGKTAIAEGLALRIAEERVPDSMKGLRVLSLDLGALLAGTKFRGEFEERLKNLVKALESLGERAVLFIDEIHTILGAGQAEGSTDAANLLKPALARGQLRCIGATTLVEFRKYFEKDAALERRFQSVVVDEPDRDTCLSVLRGLKPKYEIHHGIPITDQALQAAVDLSILYLPHRQLPDKAIDLLDEAASHLKLQLQSVPTELERLQGQAAQLKVEQELLEKQNKASKELTIVRVKLEKITQECMRLETQWRHYQELMTKYRDLEVQWEERTQLLNASKQEGNFQLAARIQSEELPKIDEAMKIARAELEGTESRSGISARQVDRQEIARVLENWTGIPVGQLLSDEKERLRSIETYLNDRVFGQQQALSVLAKAIRRSRLGLSDPGRPSGVFLFLGPTGVGKTETAKALAERLFAQSENMIRIDMSEMSESHHVSRLIGAPPGYAGYEAGGVLTDSVRHKPYSVVLLDEIDKAHVRVLDILLQILDEGRLTDGQGRSADFRHCIFILTSNSYIPLVGVKDNERDAYIRRELASLMRPELVNRFDEIVSFQKLGEAQYIRMVESELVQLNKRVANRDLRIELGNGLRKALAETAAQSPFAGRELRRAFQKWVVDAVSERMLGSDTEFKGSWVLDWAIDTGAEWRQGVGETRLLPAARS